MSKLLLHNIFSSQAQPITTTTGRSPNRNPFLQANGGTLHSQPEVGVNQPLRHPMFVGYRNDKPVYAGSRLFVLY